MAQLPDDEVQRLLEKIAETGAVYANAKARQEAMKERRRITKATLMKVIQVTENINAVNVQEREALTHPSYGVFIDVWESAIRDEVNAEIAFKNAEREWESWRTLCANERSVR